MKKNYKYITILSLFGLLNSILIIFVPFLISYLVDTAVGISDKGIKITEIYLPIILLSIVIFLEIVLKFLENYSLSSFSIKREKALKGYFYSTLLKKEIGSLTKYKSGQLEQIFNTDINYIIRYELEAIPNLFKQISRLLLAVISLFILKINIYFLLIILLCGAIGFGLAKLYSKVIKPHHKKVLDSDGLCNSYIVESINQIKLVKAYNANEYSCEYYNELNEKYLDNKKKRNLIMYSANSGLFAFSNILFLVVICFGAYQISINVLTYGSLIALIQLFNHVKNPSLAISPLLNQINIGKSSEIRLNEIVSLKEEKQSEIVDDFDSIIFENVSFSYDKEVISNLSFEIKKGETILLSGPSGIGKTTIFMLLLGFIKPNSGRIYVKYNNAEYEMGNQTRKLFSYVPQENVLFSGSIKDNIYILTGKKVEEQIEALKFANIYDEICALPNGFDTILGERGSGMSLGQIQRILIAISIISDNKILLLDEFSSALDQNNELEILSNLNDLNKTIVYITHRNNYMENQKCITLRGEKDEEVC